MRRVLPEGHFIPMEPTMAVFDSFFKIPSLDIIPQDYDRGRPDILGLFEDNDPTKRLMVIANHNTDHCELLGVLGDGIPADRRIERGVQARGQLHHVRCNALKLSI